MVGTPSSTHSEGLKIARLCMVLASISSLFIFWAIRGSSFIADRWLVAFCTVMVIIPNAVLLLRHSHRASRVDFSHDPGHPAVAR